MSDVFMADLFCGAGGSSTGLARACADLGLNLRLTAVNHWDVAIATHTANHPGARHWCMDLDQARPFDLVPERMLDIMWASPSCTEHSYAKGGNDVDDQMRASAWSVPRMAEALRPKVIIVENVPAFRNWGPVEIIRNADDSIQFDAAGNILRRPFKKRKGETFRAWFSAIESLGYSGRWELLNSADYGEAQTRIRLFAMFRSDGLPISFPAPTHARRGESTLLGITEPWVGARHIIDWSLIGELIEERARPLSPNTMRRIETGIERYCSGAFQQAFLVVLRNHADASSLDDPAPTVTAGGTHIALAEPHLEAFVLGQHGGSVARAVDEPMPTIAQDGAIALIEPFVVDVRHGDRPRVASLDDPLHTLTAKNGAGIVEPFITSYYGDKGGEPRTRSIDEPVPTIPTENRFAVVEPLVEPVTESLPASRWLVNIDGVVYKLGIRFRMLQPHELARAQGFPDDYVFTGTKSDQTAQIGNAVPEKVAYALGRAALLSLGYGIAEDAA